MSTVRLQARICLAKFDKWLGPLTFDPIKNQNGCGQYVIKEMNPQTSSAAGGTKVLLFCEKVNPKDVGLRFYELDHRGHQIWEEKFNYELIHHQFGISFLTPPYRNVGIDQPVTVYFELYSKSRKHGDTDQNRMPFTYIPTNAREYGGYSAGSLQWIVGNVAPQTNDAVFFLLHLSRCLRQCDENETNGGNCVRGETFSK